MASNVLKSPYVCKDCSSTDESNRYGKNNLICKPCYQIRYQIPYRRAKGQKERRKGIDPTNKPICSKEYDIRRKQRRVTRTEFDEFAFQEAHRLKWQRAEMLGYEWHLDHIVPLNHKLASGLHVASNLQVVPAAWNVRKKNTSMDEYFPTGRDN